MSSNPAEPEKYSLDEMLERLQSKPSAEPENSGELVTRADGSQFWADLPEPGAPSYIEVSGLFPPDSWRIRPLTKCRKGCCWCSWEPDHLEAGPAPLLSGKLLMGVATTPE